MEYYRTLYLALGRLEYFHSKGDHMIVSIIAALNTPHILVLGRTMCVCLCRNITDTVFGCKCFFSLLFSLDVQFLGKL